MENEKTEIIDFSGEKFNHFTVPCWLVFLIILLLTILDFYLMINFPESPYAILLSISIIFIFILYYYSVATKSLGKLRKFSISHQEIIFILPYRPQYIIYWSEFEKIEVRLKILRLKPFNVYFFHFINEKTEKKFTLSLNDFHKSKIIEILKLLKEHAIFMKKKFSATKETEISGVHFVEDLEII